MHLQQPGKAEQRIDAGFEIEELQRNEAGHIKLNNRRTQREDSAGTKDPDDLEACAATYFKAFCFHVILSHFFFVTLEDEPKKAGH